MPGQQEERPLFIGSAVQFTHKGETIHGHLLQRQGRRRFEKVIDTEERTWKVPEAAWLGNLVALSLLPCSLVATIDCKLLRTSAERGWGVCR